jgi:hypothetical protein
MHVDIFDSYVQARRQLRGFLFSVFLPKQLYFKLQMSDFKLNIIYNTISEALLRLLGMTDDRRQIVRLYVFGRVRRYMDTGEAGDGLIN